METEKIIYEFTSDCCDAPVKDITADGEHGICSRCGRECWACDPEMLKPVYIGEIKIEPPQSK